MKRFGPITRTHIVRYAGAGGDFNPIHHDDDAARLSGAPHVFAMGMFQAGHLSRALEETFGVGSLRRFKVRFTARVWPGDELSFHTTTVRKYTFDGEKLADLECEVKRHWGDDEEVAIKGEATVRERNL